MSRTATATTTLEQTIDDRIDNVQQYFEEIDKLTELAIAATDIKK